MYNTSFIAKDELSKQFVYVKKIHDFYQEYIGDSQPLAYIRTFGCQQNVADSEKISGWLKEMGFGFTDDPQKADFILFNTCAVREHAEDRVFGNVGALKAIRKDGRKPLIALCGCMMQQPHVAEKIKKSYPFVRLLFGTHRIHVFPQLMYEVLSSQKRTIQIPCEEDGCIAEGIPTVRGNGFSAWIPIMYGCNNYCTYCVVPHVRGRERSRRPEDIVNEARNLVQQGYKEINLLGQNVNSYGKNEDYGVNFPQLLRMINDIDGDFIIRFMTSHPKDATIELFDTIAQCKKISRHFHLPVQSGSNRILKLMNRCYTREKYLALIEEARKRIPDIAFTSDILVGFPGETEEDFLETLDLVEKVKYVSVYTFIFSPRVGTPAAKMDDFTPQEEKVKRLSRVVELQESIAKIRSQSMKGEEHRALIENINDGYAEARLSDNQVVRVQASEQDIGKWAKVKILDTTNWILYGEIENIYD